ncbi:hypothetical protein A8926_3888 [Saccharopolyspora spinosa]|uniref:Uncharacterized protein n=2 Tax=Saccharopolyspora spinosa TaxID=60894 RepID=A0A2N3XZJ5_SACSN|nr:hypothetical protein A8926_3888 [Saccharopolyspora spinosa]
MSWYGCARAEQPMCVAQPGLRRVPDRRRPSRALRDADRAGGFGVLHRGCGRGLPPGRVVFLAVDGMSPSIAAAIVSIPAEAWRQIRYPQAVVDPDTGESISAGQGRRIPAYTAFAGKPKHRQHTARLIVLQVRDLAKPLSAATRASCFRLGRYHPIVTDSPAETLQTEGKHRDHAVIERVIADGKSGPLAHLPTGKFNANTAGLTSKTGLLDTSPRIDWNSTQSRATTEINPPSTIVEKSIYFFPFCSKDLSRRCNAVDAATRRLISSPGQWPFPGQPQEDG